VAPDRDFVTLGASLDRPAVGSDFHATPGERPMPRPRIVAIPHAEAARTGGGIGWIVLVAAALLVAAAGIGFVG
jgi:hypothetical protein